MDNLALASAMEYWKHYDAPSVLRVYAELLRRNDAIPTNLIKQQNEFCKHYGYTSIDSFLQDYLLVNGYKSYLAYYESKTPFPHIATEKDFLKDIENEIIPDEIIAAGKALKKIAYILGMNVAIILLGMLISISALNNETTWEVYSYSLVISLICISIVFGLLLSVGDHLENSVRAKK